jgi:uncharacterized protein (TIRG00374 family)
MKQSFKSCLSLLRIAFGIALFAYVLSVTGSWSVLEQLRVNVWMLPGLAALTCFGAAVEVLRLRLLFTSQGIHLAFGHGYRLVAIGTFFNFAIPGGTGGDVMKLYYLASEQRGQGIEMATLLLVDRVVALFALLVLVVGLALFNRHLLVQAYTPIIWLVLAAITGMIGLIVCVGLWCCEGFRAHRLSVSLIAKMPFQRHVKRIATVLTPFRDHKAALLGAAGLSLVGHVALAGMFLAIGTVLIPPAPGLVVCLLALLGMLANALPITPGGLGVGEAAFDRLFGLVGYAGGAQLIVAWRLGMLPMCFLGCLLYVVGMRHQSRMMRQTGVPSWFGLASEDTRR